MLGKKVKKTIFRLLMHSTTVWKGKQFIKLVRPFKCSMVSIKDPWL